MGLVILRDYMNEIKLHCFLNIGVPFNKKM